MRQQIEFMRKIVNWLFRIFIWLIIEPKEFWITLLLPIFVGVIVCWFNPVGISNEPELIDILEKRFRFTGLALELSGIGTVVYGLNETLKLFLGEHLLHIIPKWFKRFPKFRDDSRTIKGSTTFTLKPATGSAFGTSTLTPNSSIENRVTFLEEQLEQVHLQLYKNRIDFENELKKLSDAFNSERNTREDKDKQAKEVHKEFVVREVYTELMGIIWLIMGASLATVSKELASIFCSCPV